MARAEAELGRGRMEAAAAAYREALRLGGARWPGHDRALAQLASALANLGDSRACATLAAAEAPHMARAPNLARVAGLGLLDAVRGDSAAWAAPARTTLVPIATRALDTPGLDRDTRFQLYRALASEAEARADTAAMWRWGARWQHELDTTAPKNDDDRTSLDIARVEAAD